MSLREDASSGVKWTTLSSLTNTIIQFLLVIVLARLLNPTDFGLVAIVNIVIGFAQLFSDAGISAAIIHHRHVSSEQLSSLYWLNIFSGVILFGILILISPIAALFFDDPRLTKLFYLASLNFLIIPIGQQFQILFQKELDFDSITKIEMSSNLFGAIIALLTAFFNLGAASIIIGQISKVSLSSFLLLKKGIKKHKPQFIFSLSNIKGFIGFGLYQMGQKSLNYFYSRIDQLLIGKLLGPTDLGYYNLAFNLVIQPISRINPIVNRVAFPVYAKIQHDSKKLKSGYFETIKYLTLINFPLLVGIAVVAKSFVLIFYGEKWEPSIILIQILAIVALIRSMGNPVGSLLLAKGRADLGFKWLLTVFSFSPIVIYFSSHYGIMYVALGMMFLQILILLLSYPFLMKPLIGSCIKEYFVDSFLIPLFYSILMGIFVLAFINWSKFDPIISLLGGVLIGAIVYLLILFIFEKKNILNLKMMFKKNRTSIVKEQNQ